MKGLVKYVLIPTFASLFFFMIWLPYYKQPNDVPHAPLFEPYIHSPFELHKKHHHNRTIHPINIDTDQVEWYFQYGYQHPEDHTIMLPVYIFVYREELCMNLFLRAVRKFFAMRWVTSGEEDLHLFRTRTNKLWCRTPQKHVALHIQIPLHNSKNETLDFYFQTNMNGFVKQLLPIPLEYLSHFSSSEKYANVISIPFQIIDPFTNITLHKNTYKLLLREGEGISIISDIDDTIKITNVTSIPFILQNTLWKKFYQVPAMNHFMSHLFEKYHYKFNGKKQFVPVHYVSSSPTIFYHDLMTFLQEHEYPMGSFHLKEMNFFDSSILNLFVSSRKTKPVIIEHLFQAYPNRKFILVGDSGEHDPYIYGKLREKYAHQIKHIYIRCVEHHRMDCNWNSLRFQKDFEQFLEANERDKITLFVDADQFSKQL